MIDFRFILNPDSDAIEITEPVGFDDMAIEVVRDPKYHGISIAYGTDDLEFIGDSATFLMDLYELYGIDAEAELQIIAECDNVEAWNETFKLDFGSYNAGCGDRCSVKMGVEQISCFQKFAAGMDKKVNIEAAVTFGGDAVPVLPNLKKSLTLPPKTLKKTTEGYILPGSDPVEAITISSIVTHTLRPVFTDTKYESIKTSQLSGPSVPAAMTGDEIVSPFLLYEEDLRCFAGGFNVNMRMKGSVTLKSEGRCYDLTVLFIRVQGEYTGEIIGNALNNVADSRILAKQNIIVHGIGPGSVPTIDLNGATASYNFDLAYYDPSLLITQDDNIFGFVFAYYEGAGETTTTANFDTDTFVKIEAPLSCQPTQGTVFLPFEIIQRISDIITDNCIELDSMYYGRTDTPKVYSADGCGAFRSLTAGLFIRNAPDAKLFTSMKEIVEGLQPIDAIGFALQRNDEGDEVLKVEPVEYFYQDKEIIALDGVRNAPMKVMENEIPGIIKIGYDKWQPESINGLDEFNSTREYRSTVRNATAPVNLTSQIIAGGYLIETTRQLSFAASGATDSKYDNDLFLIQLKRTETGLIVEQGVPEQAVNIFDPPTVYNFRVSPARNLLRWWGWLGGNSFRNAADGARNLFNFGSGTGNYQAGGFIPDHCSPEVAIVLENNDLGAWVLKPDYFNPLVRAESVTFEYPLSLDDFSRIRANPYGYISYECAGTWKKAYITKITYRMSKGKATFELRNKYE